MCKLYELLLAMVNTYVLNIIESVLTSCDILRISYHVFEFYVFYCKTV